MERLQQLIKEQIIPEHQVPETAALKKRIGDLAKGLQDRQHELKCAMNAWRQYCAKLADLKEKLRNAELLSLKPIPMNFEELNAHSKALKTNVHVLKSLDFESPRKLATKFGPDSAIQAVDDLHEWSHELLESVGVGVNKCDQLASQWAEFETMRQNVDDFLTRKQAEWRKLVEKCSRQAAQKESLLELEVNFKFIFSFSKFA